MAWCIPSPGNSVRKDIVHSGHYNKYHLSRDTVKRHGKDRYGDQDGHEIDAFESQALSNKYWVQ